VLCCGRSAEAEIARWTFVCVGTKLSRVTKCHHSVVTNRHLLVTIRHLRAVTNCPLKKHHHRNPFEEAHPEKPGYESPAEPSAGKEYGNTPVSSLPKSSSLADDDDQKQQRQTLTQPIEEFRARLNERSWKTRPSELEGVVQMVREILGNNSNRMRSFLAYEGPLTVPEQINNVGGHYRTLLKNFIAAEPNDRIEEQRKKPASREGKWDSWQCPDGNGCKKSIIEDENGIPLRICSCAKTPSTRARRAASC
jgi:hypothetical protein